MLSRHELTRGLTPEKLRRVLEDLGPTFVKFGQLLSMRPDIIPDEYCEELTRLRTDVMPMDFETVRGVLLGEYGEAPENLFTSIDSRPSGSASIAQVHRAVLKDGRQVVLKVQRPGIYAKMAQDMRLLHRASSIFRIVQKTGQVIDFDNVIDEMWSAAPAGDGFSDRGGPYPRILRKQRRHSVYRLPAGGGNAHHAARAGDGICGRHPDRRHRSTGAGGLRSHGALRQARRQLSEAGGGTTAFSMRTRIRAISACAAARSSGSTSA